MALSCEKGLICKLEVIEQCVYCSKHFCLKHGHPDKAICKSPTCMRRYKRDRAVADRATYEEELTELGFDKNAAGLCGEIDCQHEIYVTCGHCEVRFCPEHVTRYNYSFKTHTRRGDTTVKGNITLCATCKPHLKEYKRDRYE